jgi:outer membrane receptor protein involved in Fe transport
MENRVLLDVDAFYIDWKNIILLSNLPGFNYALNGGTAKSQGIEANATIRPLDGLEIDGTFAFVDAVLTEDVPAIQGVNGDRLPNIPRTSGSLRASYSQVVSGAWTGTVGAGIRAVGQRYSDVNHSYDSRPIPGYGALDLNASLSNNRYTVRLFAKNVTDKHAYLNYMPLINQALGNITQFEATVLQPRVVGISLEAKF